MDGEHGRARVQRLGVPIPIAGEMMGGIGAVAVRRAIRDGDVEAVKIAGRTLVLVSSIRRRFKAEADLERLLAEIVAELPEDETLRQAIVIAAAITRSWRAASDLVRA